MCYFVFSQVRFRGILDPTYLSTCLSTNLYKFDLKKVGWRGPPLPEWLGIEGKGCKILSRLSLSVGSQLEVSSAHSVPGSALQHWDRCHCLCSRVTDCLTLWGQAWLNLNGITASSRGRAVQIHCSAIHVTLTAGLKTDWHCTHGFSTSVQSGLERVFSYVKLFINFLSFCWSG